MPTILILAYYYSAKEEEIIRKHLKEASQTGSFFFGSVAPATVGLLRKEGILVDILPDSTAVSGAIPRNVPAQPIGRGFFGLPTDPTGHPTKANYFLIKVRGPLLPDWKQALSVAEVKIVESWQNDVYKIYTQHPLSVLQKFTFLVSVRPFETGDTTVAVKRSLFSKFDAFGPESERVAIYDVRTTPEMTEPVLRFLAGVELEVLAIGRDKVRVRLVGTRLLAELRQMPEVHAIEEYTKPGLHNDKARAIIKLECQPERGTPPGVAGSGSPGGVLRANVPYEGEGQIVGVADTGIDADHPDFEGRIHRIVARGRTDDARDPHGHGTHVAGSILGNGAASGGLIRGMAPKATLFFQSILDGAGGLGGLPVNLGDLFQEAYDEGVRIHNNSWGTLAESEYLFNSLEVDEFVYQHKDLLIVISAGNDGSAFQPRNSKPGFVDWLSLGSPATAKNALTVGASRSSRQEGGFAALTYGQAWPDVYPEDPIHGEKVSGDVECLAGFSSRGPCGNESRIKPDVVAPGTDIASTRSSLAPGRNFWGPYPNNRKYAFMGGTSMAAPIVTGYAALIREYFVKDRAHAPSAALLKATIVNGTRPLKGPDALADHALVPNFHQGFGCIDAKHTLPNELQKDLGLAFVDSWQRPALQLNATGQRFLFSLEVAGDIPLRLCLTWTDPPGRGLQNNLNLFLMHQGRQLKWTGNEDIPRTITTFDRDNNVEIIRIEEPPAGEYLIAVQAANLIFGPQDFALVVTGHLTTPLQQK